MIKNLNQKDIILFGELHNNAIAHWLELEVTKDIHKNKTVTLGAEMLEADNQTQLTNYVNGVIDAKTLDTVARLWPNYNTDYAPLVNYAKKNKLHFIATNIPRRYANLVYKKGFKSLDTLSAQEKEWIAPLPITFDSELPTYKNILKMMGDHGTPELVMAQAIKDATMAHFILKNYKANTTFIHYNGAYHSNNYEGILWYLKNENNTLNYATISTVNQEDLTKLKEEHLNIADYIICVDADMTTTY
ncbi:ChaN family lipoprotein [Cellulophaga lytica]